MLYYHICLLIVHKFNNYSYGLGMVVMTYILVNPRKIDFWMLYLCGELERSRFYTHPLVRALGAKILQRKCTGLAPPRRDWQ